MTILTTIPAWSPWESGRLRESDEPWETDLLWDTEGLFSEQLDSCASFDVHFDD